MRRLVAIFQVLLITISITIPSFGFNEIPQDTVVLTTYNAVPGQTDDTPFITASGFRLDENDQFKHRIIAVSRDLLEIYKYGDKVILEGAGRYDGVYYIRDTMNKKWERRIDILINKDGYHTKIEKVILRKVI